MVTVIEISAVLIPGGQVRPYSVPSEGTGRAEIRVRIAVGAPLGMYLGGCPGIVPVGNLFAMVHKVGVGEWVAFMATAIGVRLPIVSDAV